MVQSSVRGLKPSLGPVRRAAFVVGPVVAVVVGMWIHAGLGLPAAAAWTAGVTTLCALWWIFEPIPLAATALIPFAVFPVAGVLDHREVATAYGHHLVLLMLAGSIVSMAMERSGAHRRVAVGMVRAIGGGRAKGIVLGFLVVSAVLSMWMSNTATTVMLLPVALAIAAASQSDDLTVPLLLAVAYGASIGGSATPIGTPPNLIFLAHLPSDTDGPAWSFVDWMRVGVPVVVLMLPVAWWWLTRGLGGPQRIPLPKLGPWRSEERRVLIVFAVTALAWMTRAEPYGGWSGVLETPGYVGDSTVAIAAAVALFILPSGNPDGGRLLDWESAAKIPWGVFIMIGGGIAIGKAFDASHFGEEIGKSLVFLAGWPTLLVVVVVCLFATFLTEVTSNTAAANVLMPILAATATAAQSDALWLMLPAVLGLNYAFMLPVATAPNAIVYGTGKISTARMAREGLVLNTVAIGVITTVLMVLFG